MTHVTLAFVGEAAPYLAAVVDHWTTLGLDTAVPVALSPQAQALHGTHRFAEVRGQGWQVTLFELRDGQNRALLNLLVPEAEAARWAVPLTSPETTTIQATRGQLTVPAIGGVAIVQPRTPSFEIGGYPAPPVPEDAPDYPVPEEWLQPQGAHNSYPAGAIVQYGENRWVSLTPDNVWEPGVSGWREVVEEGSYPAWLQPTGAHDAYPLNAIVTHNGETWINTGSAANVWEPGVFGWVVYAP